jgi:hypothetical protein
MSKVINLKEHEMNKLINLEGGYNETYFKVLGCRESEIVYYPAIKDGKEMTPFEFKTFDEYVKHKTKVVADGYVLTVTGNAVCAEAKLMEMGYKASAVNPTTVEVIIK